MNLLGTISLETDRLLLRKTIEEDFLTYFEIIQDFEMRKYYSMCRMGEDSSRDEFYFKQQLGNYENENRQDFYRWSIIKKEDNSFIGMINVFTKKDNREIKDIGWFIKKEERGFGFAFEASKEIVRYLFENVEIREIDTNAAMYNPASFNLMEKLGFKRIESEVLNYYYGGEVLTYHYKMKQEDYLIQKEYDTKMVKARALIIDENNNIYISNMEGNYILPGGTVEMGEESIDTIKRELKEELGILDCKIERLKTFQFIHENFPRYKEGGFEVRLNEVYLFLVTSISKNTISPQLTEYEKKYKFKIEVHNYEEILENKNRTQKNSWSAFNDQELFTILEYAKENKLL